MVLFLIISSSFYGGSYNLIVLLFVIGGLLAEDYSRLIMGVD